MRAVIIKSQVLDQSPDLYQSTPLSVVLHQPHRNSAALESCGGISFCGSQTAKRVKQAIEEMQNAWEIEEHMTMTLWVIMQENVKVKKIYIAFFFLNQVDKNTNTA